MSAGVTVKIKGKAGAFTGGELQARELGLDLTTGDLYGSVNGSTVFKINIDTGITDIVQDNSPQLGGNLDAQGNRISSLGDPSVGTDAVNKNYVDGVVQGHRWGDPVIDIQVDASLDPGGSPSEGDRYIITDAGSLHANFGTITGVGDDDIVEFDGDDFVVVFDASVVGEGHSVYDKDSNTNYNYNGSAWVVFGGTSAHSGLSGLANDDHTQYSIISSGSGAPGTTPPRIGAIYVDTGSSPPVMYVAKGSSSSADWQAQVNHSSTLNSAAMTIDGGTI